jgi:hypothetical protein
MEEGLRFAIREGGRTVGAGVVAKDHRVTFVANGEKGDKISPFRDLRPSLFGSRKCKARKYASASRPSTIA